VACALTQVKPEHFATSYGNGLYGGGSNATISPSELVICSPAQAEVN